MFNATPIEVWADKCDRCQRVRPMVVVFDPSDLPNHGFQISLCESCINQGLHELLMAKNGKRTVRVPKAETPA